MDILLIIGLSFIAAGVGCHISSVYLYKKLLRDGAKDGLFFEGLDKHVSYWKFKF